MEVEVWEPYLLQGTVDVEDWTPYLLQGTLEVEYWTPYLLHGEGRTETCLKTGQWKWKS